LGRQTGAKAASLPQLEARAGELDRDVRDAQVASEAAAARLRGAQASAFQRGERLRVIDPGVVPERPSSPNVGLNVALALGVALIACITYLTLIYRPVSHDRGPLA
jgi:uncharacterized protein involved in exopolysaccharide biosynthesis